MTTDDDLNQYEIQLLSDINRHYRHLQLSTYGVQWEVKDLEKIICSAQRCIYEKEKLQRA